MIRFSVTAALAATILSTVAPIAHAADSIHVMCPVWSGFAPVLVAKDLGYYDEAGLDVDVRFEDDRSNVMAAMERGDIDIDMRTVGEYQARPRTAQTDGVVIGLIDQSLGGDGVVADGSIRTVADLKGKVVAQLPSLPALLLLQLDLKNVGLTLKDVVLKDTEVADTAAVFSDPSIAAVVSAEPFISQTIKLVPSRNPHLISSSADHPGYIVDAVIARKSEVAQYPDKYRRFLIALYKTTQFAETNPEKFAELAAVHYNLSAADFSASIKGSLTYTQLDEAKTAMGTPDKPGSLYGVFDTLMQLVLEGGGADAPLSAASSINNSIIAKIAPADLK
ncbi:ABC transporter substrate-binding protein [Rhizobium pusense]|uniref:ABC transporter substrate-binding protein n=1 Tax=Agrobacterium pusense TaxID=648995 RepID=UPI0024492286|nr:ABC transporter substrate-binding protein [Agrobacterium pusense]MDH2091632.1 ABC transporter substrate-binding protein [Agrobacterium pusense]